MTPDLAKAAASKEGIAAGKKLDGFLAAREDFFLALLDPSTPPEKKERLRCDAMRAEEAAKESFFGFMRGLGLCDFEDEPGGLAR